MPIQMIDAAGNVLDSKEIEKMYKEIECKITEVLKLYNLTLGQAIDVLENTGMEYRAKTNTVAFNLIIS